MHILISFCIFGYVQTPVWRSLSALPVVPSRPLVAAEALHRGDIVFNPVLGDYTSSPCKADHPLVFTPSKATQVPSPSRSAHNMWSVPKPSTLRTSATAPLTPTILFAVPDAAKADGSDPPPDHAQTTPVHGDKTDKDDKQQSNVTSRDQAILASDSSTNVPLRAKSRRRTLRPSMYLPEDRVRVALEKSPDQRHDTDIAALEAELSRLTVFAYQPEAMRRQLCGLVQMREFYCAGSTVTTPSTGQESWWVVLTGSVAVCPDSDRQSGTGIFLGEGEAFGYKCPLPGKTDIIATNTPATQLLRVHAADYEAARQAANSSTEQVKKEGKVVVVTERRVVDTFDRQGAPLQTSITLVVKASPAKLLRLLFSRQERTYQADPTFLYDFLLTYRVFLKPQELLQALRSHLKKTRARAVDVLKMWAREFGDQDSQVIGHEFLQLERRLCVGYARDTHATDLTHAAAALRALQTKLHPARMVQLRCSLFDGGKLDSVLGCSLSLLPDAPGILLATSSGDEYTYASHDGTLPQVLFVTSVESGGYADRAGLLPGDRLLPSVQLVAGLNERKTLELGVGVDHGGALHVLSPSMLREAMQVDDHVVVIAVNDPSLESHLNQGDYYNALQELYLRQKPRRRASSSASFVESPSRRSSGNSSNPGTPRRMSLSSPGFFKRRKKPSSALLQMDAEAERHGGIAQLMELQDNFDASQHHVVKIFHADSTNSKLLAITQETRTIDIVLYLTTLWGLKSKRRHCFRLVVAKLEEGHITREYELDDVSCLVTHCQGSYRLFLTELARTQSVASSNGSQELDLSTLHRVGSNGSLSSTPSEVDSRSNSPARASRRRKASKESVSTTPVVKRNGGNYVHLGLLSDAAQKEMSELAIHNVLLQADASTVAQQLALSNFELFAAVHPLEYVATLWPKLALDRSNLDAFADRFNWIVRWVKTSILIHKQDAKRRADSIKRMVAIAAASIKLGDFLAGFAVISGLACSEVSRLKKTWSLVKGSVKQEYDELEALMNPTRNMAAYRTLFAQASQHPPVIPFLPLLMKDLAFIHEGNETFVDGLVNFDKLRMIARELRNIAMLVRMSKSSLHTWCPPPASSLKSALTQQESLRTIKEAIFNSQVIDDEERFLGLSFFCEQSRHLLRHLKISEPIPQRLGTGTDQELLDVEDALALFGPRSADGTAVSAETTPTKTAAKPVPPLLEPSPSLIRDRTDSASSTQSLYGEDLVHYSNLRRLPADSSDPNSPRDRYIQVQSVSSIDGGLEYATASSDESSVLEGDAPAIEGRKPPSSPLAHRSQGVRQPSSSPSALSSAPMSPRQESNPVIVQPSPLTAGSNPTSRLRLSLDLTQQQNAVNESTDEQLPSPNSESPASSKPATSTEDLVSNHTGLTSVDLSTKQAQLSDAAEPLRPNAEDIHENAVPSVDAHAEQATAQDQGSDSTDNQASEAVLDTSPTSSQEVEAILQDSSVPVAPTPDEELPNADQAMLLEEPSHVASVDMAVTTPALPDRDYDDVSDPTPLTAINGIEAQPSPDAPTTPLAAGTSEIDAWIASVSVPSYQAPSEPDDVESMLAALHVPPPDLFDLPSSSSASSTEALLTPPSLSPYTTAQPPLSSPLNFDSSPESPCPSPQPIQAAASLAIEASVTSDGTLPDQSAQEEHVELDLTGNRSASGSPSPAPITDGPTSPQRPEVAPRIAGNTSPNGTTPDVDKAAQPARVPPPIAPKPQASRTDDVLDKSTEQANLGVPSEDVLGGNSLSTSPDSLIEEPVTAGNLQPHHPDASVEPLSTSAPLTPVESEQPSSTASSPPPLPQSSPPLSSASEDVLAEQDIEGGPSVPQLDKTSMSSPTRDDSLASAEIPPETCVHVSVQDTTMTPRNSEPFLDPPELPNFEPPSLPDFDVPQPRVNDVDGISDIDFLTLPPPPSADDNQEDPQPQVDLEALLASLSAPPDDELPTE
eukprot:m.240491 g.240491  ORF g.240491 m.240491 type:complete len:1952 (-) comp17439_c0_seq8:839-6694(-)